MGMNSCKEFAGLQKDYQIAPTFLWDTGHPKKGMDVQLDIPHLSEPKVFFTFPGFPLL
jgi:hypothetical protein